MNGNCNGRFRRIKSPAGLLISAAFVLALTMTASAQGKIVFSSQRDGGLSKEIFIMDDDGTNPVRLTNDPANDYAPALSPDGSKIVFVSNRDGNDEIYVMNADGSGQTRLTSNAAQDSDPSFSGDGSKIAFRSARDAGNYEIYVMNADGTGQVNLTNHPGADGMPSFSPVSGKIVFYSNRHGDPMTTGIHDIYVMNSDGSGVTRLTDTPGDDVRPSFSPDGTKIVFESTRTGGYEIYIMNADGSGQTRLTFDMAINVHAAFSPDGGQIAYQTSRDLNFEIFKMNLDGTNQVRLTNQPGPDEDPAWGVRANTDPTITADPLSVERDAIVSGLSVATAGDAEDAENSLTVTVNGGLSATVNGVTVSNLAVDSSGQVTANIATGCGSTNAAFTLRVTDSGSLYAETTLNVAVTDETTDPILFLPADIVTSLPPNSTDTGRMITFTASATDNCDANPTVTADPPSGSIFPVGTTTVEVTATDASGNTATGNFSVTVLYDFSGFFQPVDNLPVVNMVGAGQSVPVKFSLSGNKGLNIFAAGYPVSQPIVCVGGATVSSVEETVTAGSSSLTYDADADRYLYVWKTEKSWRGTCRQLIVKLNDGSQHVANFQFR